MKKITPPYKKFLIALLMFSGLFATAQTAEQVQKITASYDKVYLMELATKSLEKSQAEKKAAIEYAQARNIPISYTTKDGAYSELQRVRPNGTLLYYKTDNVDAARSTRTNHLNIGGSTGYDLDGQNMTAYVWDGGHPRITHQEYHGAGGNNRVSLMDVGSEGGTQLSSHAAHVAGTITASGVDPDAKGMAPRSKVRAYKWNNDLAEATAAAADGMLLSNHSYGYEASELEYYEFGAYLWDAQDWDNLMFNAPYYLMVNSAGNDGNDNTSNGNPLAYGYDKLNSLSTSKNNLVVAAANDANVDGNGNLISVSIGSFSSQGPTNDLRIKPDITGNGVEVYSTFQNSNYSYGTESGTSMSSPNVTGSLLLLQEHYHNISSNFMRGATLKGLALHTTDDAGPVGPDAVWGWGLMNAKRAAETITQNGSESLIQEMVINQGQTITLAVDSDGLNELMASISWTDRPGALNDELNSPTPTLINDLDIRVTKNTDTYYPWRLTSVTTNDQGDNIVDPYERVDVQNASGTYTITITHKGNLVGGSQAFSLIITGIQVECITASIPQNVLINDITGNTATVSWDPTPGALYDLRYREINTTTWTDILDISTSNYEITELEVYTEYEVEVRSKCSLGEPSAYSDAVSFSTTGLNYCDSFALNSDDDFYISNVNLNTINNTSAWTAYSDFTNISTELVAGQTYTISLTTTADNPAYDTSYSAWIDYNRNGIFELGEQIFTIENITAGDVASSSFTVPINVDPLSTTMRVSMSNDEIAPGPCEVFDFGEVEDYTIHLKLPYTDFIYEDSNWTPENPAGVSTAVDNILIVNGSTSFTTDIDANNLTINATASLAVEKVLNIAGNLNNNGELIFISSATGNGELGPISGSSTITGNVTVQRYMSSNRAYRMVSSEVTTTSSIHDNWQEGANSNTDDPASGFGTHITGSTIDQQNGFDASATGNPSMFTINPGEQQFTAVSNTDVKTLEAGTPYLVFVRGDRSIDLAINESVGETVLRATGSLHTGLHEQSFVTNTPGHFVMFGNPYQSAVDINSVFENSTNVNTNQYYIYDPTLASKGAYVTVDLDSGMGTSGSNANQYLQPGQGAQLSTLAAGSSDVVFNEIDKAPDNFTSSNATGNNLSADNMLTVQLYTTENFITNGPLHDSFGIIFADGNDNALTPVDALKPMNFEENLGVDHNGTYLSLERRAMPLPAEVYSLYSSGYKHSEYTLKLNINGLENIFFYLDDHFTDESTLLENGETIYSFGIDAYNPMSIAPDRFSIRTEEQLGVDNNDILSGIRLFPNPIEGNSFYIHAPKLKGKTVAFSVSDMLGRQIYRAKQTFHGNTINIDLTQDLKSGIYTVTLLSTGETRSFKIIKR